jgi:hypothetical protein
MEKDIRQALIKLARLQRTETYSWLNNELGMGLNFDHGTDRSIIGDWLGDVSLHENKNDRPLLSVLITHKGGKREQGNGFYKLCQDIYGRDWELIKADKRWEKNQIARCFEFWLDTDNSRKYKNDF